MNLNKVLKRAGQITVLISLLSVALGCEAMNHNGRTISGTFPDPKAATLVRAAEDANVNRMRTLVQEGADVNYAGKNGVTPLVWVMADRDYGGVEALLKLGANPNQKMTNHNSPMWLAAGRDDLKMLKLMLQYHGDPNIIGAGQITALEIAVRQFLIPNIDLLVRSGANINYADNVGQSAATWAAALGHFDIVVHLLELGYSHNLQDLAGWVEARKVNPEEQPNKDRVIAMLRARGVQYPVPRKHPHAVPASSRT